MKISVLTLFPEAYSALYQGIIGKALEKGLFSLEITNIRDYSANKHKKCDDYPFGGGAGMVMTPQPLHDAINAVDRDHKAKRIYLSPKGRRLDQDAVRALAAEREIVLVNGSYEGIDERIIELDVDCEISIGDYVLTNGTLPAAVLVDAVARYVPGVLGEENSLTFDSFNGNLLAFPQYTRPAEFRGMKVPEVLMSGNHKEIENWRKSKQLERTKKRRPDILKK